MKGKNLHRVGVYLITIVLVAWTSWVFAQETEEVVAEEVVTEEVVAAEPVAETNERGQAIFEERCARCHGEDGQAGTRMGERFEIGGFTADQLNTLGAEGIATTVTEGSEIMRAITDFSDEDMAALVAYAMTLGQ